MRVIGEVVKLFEVDVPGMARPVKGKIVKVVNSDGKASFTWSISHNYKPTAQAFGVYFPSKITTPTLDEAEALFKGYAASFTSEHQTEANPDF